VPVRCCATTPKHLYDSWPEWRAPEGTDTGIKVFNRLVKAKVPFITQRPGLVKWYMCGPTVYDSAHIGHGLCYVRFDVLRRILTRHFGLRVVLVMGVTDVDDKIIAKAAYFNQPLSKVTQHYEKEFWEDMASLGVGEPSVVTRVTEHMAEVERFVGDIEEKGLTYRAEDGSVYFDNVAYRRLRGLQSPGPGEEPSPGHKRHRVDFALWKAAKPGEPAWQSRFGPGRPGWHIECSAMASSVLGESLDVHSGGEDLLFPHHHCEEAQSCARHGSHMWTNYWWHSGHLSINQEKMSKSVGNVISVRKLLESYSADTFRHYVLMSHYRSTILFHEKTLNNAAGQVNKIKSFLHDCDHFVRTSRKPILHEPPHPILQEVERTRQRVDACLRDDFNTGAAVRAVLRLVGLTSAYLRGDTDPTPAPEAEEEDGPPGPPVEHSRGIAISSIEVSFVAEFVRKTMATFGANYGSADTVGAGRRWGAAGRAGGGAGAEGPSAGAGEGASRGPEDYGCRS